MTLRESIAFSEALKQERLEEYFSELTAPQRLDLMRYTEVIAGDKIGSLEGVSMGERYNVYTDITKMSLSQFIYFEHEFGNELTEGFVSLFVRPKDEVSFDNTTDAEDKHLQSLLEEDILEILQIFHALKMNREFVLFTKFNGVIYTRVEVEEGEDDDYAPNPFTQRWFWYSIVRKLANDDITRFDKIYELKMSDVLVDLAYQIQLAEVEENERRAQEALHAARYR